MASKTIGELCVRVCSGGTPKSGNADYYEGGVIPWLNTREVNFNRIRATEGFITEAGLEASSAKWIRPNAVIVAMYGATAGRCAISKIPLTTNQACCNLEINDEVADYRYIYYWLMAHYSQVAGMANGGAQQNLNAKQIRELKIELPELNYQRRVAEFLSSLDAKIDLNQQSNDYLAEMCETIAAAEVDGEGVLADISMQVVEKVACSESSLESYVSTESLLPDKSGRQKASSLPTTGKVTVYKTGDTLVSNIRPYFKKIWFADRDGTCSGDVIVFRAKDPSRAAYLYSVLRSNSFFEHVMAGAKGTKMPRGDKKQMMQYPVASESDQGLLDSLTAMIEQIGANNKENETLSDLRDALLPKLMSGEIDASMVEISIQPK